MCKLNCISGIRAIVLVVVSSLLLPTAARAARITDGLVALYDLAEGSGEIIHDSATNQLNLRIPAGDLSNKVCWPPDSGCMATGGICITGNTVIASGQGAVKLSDALTMTNDITIEAWVRPANSTQGNDSEGAQIVNMALGNNVSFTLNQMGSTYGGGVKSSGGLVGLTKTPEGAVKVGASELPQHVVYTSSDDLRTAIIYVDNEPLNSRGASFRINADPDHPLALGGRQQAVNPWHGEIYLVAIYNKALSHIEIGQNFLAGPNTPSPPPLLGDYNQDGSVDAADYVVWRNLLGEIVAPCSGPDANCNGFVDNTDYEPWRNEFGRSIDGTMSATEFAHLAVIPEPTTAMLWSIAVICTATRRRLRF
jgi:hypothetical protein